MKMRGYYRGWYCALMRGLPFAWLRATVAVLVSLVSGPYTLFRWAGYWWDDAKGSVDDAINGDWS